MFIRQDTEAGVKMGSRHRPLLAPCPVKACHHVGPGRPPPGGLVLDARGSESGRDPGQVGAEPARRDPVQGPGKPGPCVSHEANDTPRRPTTLHGVEGGGEDMGTRGDNEPQYVYAFRARAR